MSGTGAGADDPEAIMADWYEHHYSTICSSADGSAFATYMHRALERRPGVQTASSQVLEIGGNEGEHVPFVTHPYADYLLTDLRPPTPRPEVAADPRVRTGVADASNLPYPDATVDRVIATCVLHHVPSPLVCARQMRRVCRPGGTISVLLPTDPGLAYRVGKALTSGRAARKAGLESEHRLLAAVDHRNHVRSVLAQVRHAFRDDALQLDWYPFRVPSVELNAFLVVTATRGA